mmetsp:Transcript_1178/g.1771  ORF Transcript_1178/g.1771 Transcript_1178/m.1771 type:complete len:611 (-) Transcript_1178:1636-3468(-)
MICAQIMVLGSRSIDFMNTELTDHEVLGLVIRNLDEIDDNFDDFHDYNKNATSIQPCDLVDDETSNVQTNSPGILLILEAEDADLINSDNLEGIITSAIEKTGLTAVSASTTKSDDGNAIVSIILREGYVIARSMPGHRYCAFDIHLWSSFETQESAKAALLSAVGSNIRSSSAFRIIAGGMLGTPSWKLDENIRGPQRDEICELFEPVSNNFDDMDKVKGMRDDGSIDTVMKESIKLLQGQNQKVAVLCGMECPASSKFENIDNVEQVIVFNCPSMVDFNEFGEGSSDALSTCEQHLAQTLEVISENGQLDTLVIDPTAHKTTSSILLKVLTSRKKLTKQVFSPQVKILSTFSQESERWCIHLLKIFKNRVFFKGDFVFYTEILFSGEEGSFKLLVTSNGDEHFIKDLRDNLDDLEKGSGMTPKILNINGGMWHHQKNFLASRLFSPEDYDQTSPLEQWNSQNPLGHQIVFQMEPKPTNVEKKSKVALSNTVIRKALEVALLQSPLPLFEKDDIESIEEYNGAGDGSVLVFLWSGGSIAVLWNGREHVDLNVFVYKGDQVLHSLKLFERNFHKVISTMTTILRDEHPRGVGRVISYWDDIKEGVKPHWA